MKRINKQNGITLIALVITIIVMLILVSVTISMAINGNLFNYAGQGAQKTEQAKQEEEELSSGRVQVDGIWYDSLQDVANENPSENQGDGEINSGIKNYNDTEKDDTKKGVLKANAYWIDYDEKGNEIARAVVPKGFKVIEGFKMVDGEKVVTNSIEDGLVIQDEEGNEFVWIPVDVVKEGENKDSETSIASFYRSSWSENGRTTGLSKKNTEPYASGYSDGEGTEEKKDYYDMLKSVYTYEGFYIGRYEAGSTVARTSTGINEDGGNGTTKMVVKQDAYPYIYIGWGLETSDYTRDVTYEEKNQGAGALALSKAMYKDNEEVTSTLCYGVMWDAMLDFIKDDNHNVTNSTTWGNYYNSEWTITRTTAKWTTSPSKDKTWNLIDDEENDQKSKTSTENILLTTGASDSFSAKNIYDVAGNVYEWTNEANNTRNRIARGGSSGTNGKTISASYRLSIVAKGCQWAGRL